MVSMASCSRRAIVMQTRAPGRRATGRLVSVWGAAEHRHRPGLDGLREEPELAQVHTEDRYARAGPARDREQRAVAAEHDDQVGLARESVLVERRGAAEAGVGVEQRLDAAAPEPADHPVREACRPRTVALHHQ